MSEDLENFLAALADDVMWNICKLTSSHQFHYDNQPSLKVTMNTFDHDHIQHFYMLSKPVFLKWWVIVNGLRHHCKFESWFADNNGSAEVNPLEDSYIENRMQFSEWGILHTERAPLHNAQKNLSNTRVSDFAPQLLHGIVYLSYVDILWLSTVGSMSDPLRSSPSRGSTRPISPHPLQSANQCCMELPSPHEQRNSGLFSCVVPRWWNELLNHIQLSDSLSIFKKHLKSHLFQDYLH